MSDIATCACLMFSFTCANHLGLVEKVENIIGYSIPIVNCPKCATFWSTLICLVSTGNVAVAVALSFLFAYLALWLELAMCVIDNLYKKVYEKIISDSASDKASSDADTGNTEGPLS